jgi:hypothetical protein
MSSSTANVSTQGTSINTALVPSQNTTLSLNDIPQPVSGSSPSTLNDVNLNDLPEYDHATKQDDIKIRFQYINYCKDREWLPLEYVDEIQLLLSNGGIVARSQGKQLIKGYFYLFQ